jgi:hypothetical protein
MCEPELVGFDGNAAVIDGGVSPAVMDAARSRQEEFKRKHPDDEQPSLRDCIVSVLEDREGTDPEAEVK